MSYFLSQVLSKFWCESGLLVLRLVRKMGRCCCLVSGDPLLVALQALNFSVWLP